MKDKKDGLKENKETVDIVKEQEVKQEGNNDNALDIEKMPADDLKILTKALIVENTELEKQIKYTAAEKDKLSKIAAKAGELSAMYSSLSKDFDVYRKRNAEIESISRDKAVIEIGIKIIPVYDNLKRALDGTSDEKAKEGVKLIYRQFALVLKSLDVVEFAEEGDDFDPNRHNAVMAAETEEAALKGKIKQVYSVGYSYKDKIIKQSQVVVYK